MSAKSGNSGNGGHGGQSRLERLERAIQNLTRFYKVRKATGRPYGMLLVRCRTLTEAWLVEKNAEREAERGAA